MWRKIAIVGYNDAYVSTIKSCHEPPRPAKIPLEHPTQGVALGYNIAPLWGFKMPNLMAVTRCVGTRKANRNAWND
jgi:hypothetical protein